MGWIDSKLRWSRLLQQTIATCSERDGETMSVRVIAICWASDTDGERTCRKQNGKGKCSRDRKRQTNVFLLKCGAGFKQNFGICCFL